MRMLLLILGATRTEKGSGIVGDQTATFDVGRWTLDFIRTAAMVRPIPEEAPIRGDPPVAAFPTHDEPNCDASRRYP